MASSKVIVTPKGKIGWNHIKEPSVFKGNPIGYDVELILNRTDHSEFIDKLQALLDAEYSKEIERLKAKKKFAEAKTLILTSPFKTMYDAEGNETDEVLLKFTQKIKNLATPPAFVVVDKDKERIDVSFIPKNSIIKIAFIPLWWTFGGKAGLTLKLKGIQVIELRSKDFVEEDEVIDVFSVEDGDPFKSNDTPELGLDGDF